jgi:hypothetical protein
MGAKRKQDACHDRLRGSGALCVFGNMTPFIRCHHQENVGMLQRHMPAIRSEGAD